ncbi:MAG: peptidyl-prolyl cis-trans isomerase [Firmicutes bacterium]|nr:peptidyl-prolyl cis-trans isomerase [Bacillota bacterium]
MKKLLMCLCLLLTVGLIVSCASQLDNTPDKTDIASPSAGLDVIGSVNGSPVYRYEYDYYFNSYFNEYFSNYYDSILSYQGVDMLDESSAHDFLADLENFAWNSSVQASLIRQMAAEEYAISLDPSYYENLLSPEVALSINTNRLWGLIYPHVGDEAKAAKGVSDDEAKEYYDVDPSAWDCYKVAHIIVTAQQLMDKAVEEGQELNDDEAQEAARQLAEDIIVKLKAGEDFADLAAQYSADGTSETGGEMDLYFNIYGSGISDEAGFDPLFSEGAFLLKNVGDFSQEPVESSFGFHIIKLLDKKVGFDAVKSFVLDNMESVEDSEISEFFQNKMQAMQDAATIERDFDFIYYVEPPEGAEDEVVDDQQ